MRPYIPTLLLLFVINSCTDSYLDGVFDRAEAIMEEHPDSSLAMLKGLDLAGIDSPRKKARFALDYAMALDKNWLDRNSVVSYLIFRKRQGEALSILSQEQPETLPLAEQIAYWWLMIETYEGLGAYKEAISAQRKYDSAVETLSFQHLQSDLRSAEERYKAQRERYRSIKRSIIYDGFKALRTGKSVPSI